MSIIRQTIAHILKYCSKIYEETVKHVTETSDPIPDVAILREGFTQFQVKYKVRSSIILIFVEPC